MQSFLIAPLFDHVLLTQGLVLFTLFLLVIRFLSDFTRNLVLLFASVILLEILTSPLYAFLFFVVVSAIYYLLFWIQGSPRRRRFSWLLAASLVVLYFLLMDLPALRTPWTGQMVHRFGVAYSLFRLLALVLDVGNGASVAADPLEYFSFCFFAPTFFQGPIERLQEFRQNLVGRPTLSLKETGSQLLRIAGAFLKGWVVLHFLELDWKQYFDRPQQLSYVTLVWGMYARAIGFYLFVSAANDLTIACSALAGYRIHENYDYPYFKRNLALFWRSWHMTLVQSLRDYLYIPLGGNRRHVYRNTLIVFLSIALWHVTSVAFLIWGLWHGIGMCALRLWQNYWKKVEAQNRPAPARTLQIWSRRYPAFTRVASTVFTFHFVALGWLPFWGGHPQGLSMILRLISGNHWRLFEW